MDYLHHRNPLRLDGTKEAIAAPCVQNLSDWQGAVAEIVAWPEYQPQPLHALDHMARRLGIGKLYYKDESRRFGTALGSFKALGAPYAVYSLLASHVASITGITPTAQQLRERQFESITSRVTVCVATDGNQGRGLAYAARAFGCRCVTYIHAHVSPYRKEAMEALGAIVIRIDGEYEDSVLRAKQDARLNGWHFVSSTSWDDFSSPIPRNVMNAYMVMVEEALGQIPNLESVTHVFMQGGVGSIAAAVFLGFLNRMRANPPAFILVEPIEADCLYRSAIHGQPTPSQGNLRTIMAGLACREVSPAAWKILDWLTSDFLAVPDEWAASAMRELAIGRGDIPLVCGESAAGGLGTLLATATRPELFDQLRLSPTSQCVLFGCEGATDPTIYQEITGESPDTVFARQAAFPAILVP